ncbi:MAG: YggS family pyridoxal phosphate-dependent enzyme [Calditrichaeota bacterium]|nr:MAG: YggS family pyridoxal phosphate-dependent enzyme [Calditrichota bacterium]
MEKIIENLGLVRQRIASACLRSGRNVNEIEIVAVTKTVPPERIELAIQAGIRQIGENRVQEAAAKKPRVHSRATWHMVGHLQTNKVGKALQLFDMIQSVDSLHLAEKLQEQCEKLGCDIEVLIQVNTSGEETKFGVAPADTFSIVKDIAHFPALKIKGLMTIGPLTYEEEKIRQSFSLLRNLFLEIDAAHLPAVEMKILSMGMTDDFEIAIEEGATMLRLGRAIFGERN